MRRRVALFSALAIAATSLVGITGGAAADPSPVVLGQSGQSGQYQVSGPRTQEDKTAIARTGAVVDHVEHGRVYVTATGAEAERIRELGFTVEVMPDPPKRGGNPQVSGFPPQDSGYHDYAETLAELDRIAEKFPELAQKTVIGKSYEGRDIAALKISDNVTADEDEPEVLFNANIHAREHLTTEQALYLANLFTGDYGSNSRVTEVVDSREIWIIPMLNPDGSEYDHATGSYRSWRKNRQPNAGSSYVGTDLNRNFGYKWGCCGGSSGSPSSDTYRGTGPFSATELDVLRDFVLSRRVDGEQQIKAHIDIHSYSELILWPYGYTYSDLDTGLSADQEATFRTIGREMAATNGYTPQQSSDLYITDGASLDWMWGDQGIWSYVFELYPDSPYPGFYPPDEVIPTETARNKEAALILAEYADCPYRAIGKQQQYCSQDPAEDDFSVSVSPSAGSVEPGEKVTATVATRTTAGEDQEVSLSAEGLPAGASAVFSPESVVSGESASLTVRAGADTAPGTYPVTVKGAGEEVTRSATYTLTVKGEVPKECGTFEVSRSGSLRAGGSAYQPDGAFFLALRPGVHEACLEAPQGATFGLELQKWAGSGWATVASGEPGARAELTYSGESGYYRYRVEAAGGSGTYTLGYDVP